MKSKFKNLISQGYKFSQIHWFDLNQKNIKLLSGGGFQVFMARTSLFKHHWDEVGWVQLEQWV